MRSPLQVLVTFVAIGCATNESTAGSCMTDYDCTGEEICSSWKCTAGGNVSCVIDFDCPATDICVAGICVTEDILSSGFFEGIAVIATFDPKYPMIAGSKSGEKVVVLGGQESIGQPSGLIWFDKDARAITVFFQPDGLPHMIVSGGIIVVFSNYDGTKVDVAVITSGAKMRVERDVTIDEDLTTELAALRGGKVDTGSPWPLWKLLKFALLGAKVAVCAAAVAGVVTAPVGIACASALIATLILVSEEDEPLLEASGVALGALGCVSGGRTSCITLVLGLAGDALKCADSDKADMKNEIDDAVATLGGGCLPSCGSSECGDDGCSGSCGSCSNAEVCKAGACVSFEGTCVPKCQGKECGSDDCGGTCGNCADGKSCVDGFCACNIDGTNVVADQVAGLYWQKAPSSSRMTRNKAIAYCESRTDGGFQDWRLPYKNEVVTIMTGSGSCLLSPLLDSPCDSTLGVWPCGARYWLADVTCTYANEPYLQVTFDANWSTYECESSGVEAHARCVRQ